MSNGHALAVPGPIGSLEAYARQVEQYPRLSADEERELAERYRQRNDLNAAFTLVLSHLRLSLTVARQYRGYGLPLEDLVQEGNVGLMKAVKRFDPSRGVRLFKYALLWIRAEIHDYILRNWRIVRVATTQAKKKLFYKLRSAKKQLHWISADEAGEIAAELDVEPEDVLEMDERLYGKDQPFDEPTDDGSDAPAASASLGDLRFAPDRLVEAEEWTAWATRRLSEAFKTLDLRSRDIVVRRWLNEDRATLQQLADEYGLSAERIRQIERAAIEKLRQSCVMESGG